ncbi:hypothetical protein SY88_15465 [Clostridiales bacterium PH28_bin88]|nr:hypothetical protein SY88_15465 [Clostridiales bacterium PH28_bin88]
MENIPEDAGKPAAKQGASRAVNVQVYRWVILLVTTGAQASISFIPQGIGALAPFLAAGLNLNKTQVGFAGGAVNVGMTFTSILAGRAVDLWGEKTVLVVGGVCTGAAIILASRSGSFPVLLALLLFTGLWAATSTPAGGKAIMTWFPYSQRGFAMGVRQTGVPLGGLLAALILPPIAFNFNWRAAMAGMGLVAFFGAALCLVAYKDYPEKTGTGQKGMTKAGSVGTVLRNPDIWLVGFTAITYVAAQFTLVTYLMIYFNDKIGISIRQASIFLAMAQLAGAAGRVFWGVVSDKVFRGARKPALFSVGIVVMVMSLTMVFLTSKTPIWVVGLVSWFFGFSAIGWNGLFVALVSEMVGKEQAGTALGMGLSLVQVGVLIFPPIFGFLVDRSGSYQTSWITLSLLVLLGILLLGLVHERKDESAGRTVAKGV